VLFAFSASAGEAARDAAVPRLEGTFIQYQDWMMKIDAAAWRRELDAMRRAKIRIVIIQWLQMDESRFIPPSSADTDPTRVILDYADEHGMQVFLGLATENRWLAGYSSTGYLDRAAAASIRIADEAWTRYGRHRSFAGWYIPHEMRDAYYNSKQIIQLRDFLRRLSDHCRAISGDKLVSMSPTFSGQVPPEIFQRLYIDLLTGAGVDILMLQDGIGVRGWNDADLETRVVPYFRAMQGVCETVGMELWSDLEIFHRREGTRVPTTIGLLKRQIEVESPFVRRFVTFDFFHYMSPFRGDAQKKLYEDYLRQVVDAERTSP
jgi:hypothetical protein